MIESQVLSAAQEWITHPVYDEATKSQVRFLLDYPQELTDAFFKHLSFGTGGIRGVMGVGTNRINIYTIRRASQALANYLLLNGNSSSKSVVIAYDSRRMSKEFAEETAKVLAGNGLTVFLSQEPRPTPYLSFACSHLQTQAGVMITASHNPKQYNGYKVYSSQGGQITSLIEKAIILESEKISSPSEILITDLSNPLIQPLEFFLEKRYLQEIYNKQLFPHLDHRSLKIIYTNLHGIGISLMPQALSVCGFSPCTYILSQLIPNSDFPTVVYPNPEEATALKLGIEALIAKKADILLATDPDADRVAVAILHKEKPYILSGNELAAIGAYTICLEKQRLGVLQPGDTLVTTLVTTPLLKKIAAAFSIEYEEVLPGFKYISKKIEEIQQQPHRACIFGAEESYGYLFGTLSKDKDGISAACLFAQIASQTNQLGTTLLDLLFDIYQRFGIQLDKQHCIHFEEGKKGLESIDHSMKRLRAQVPQKIGNLKVISTTDYLKQTSLPPANIIKFELEDGSRLIIRPSGTEARLKFYVSAYGIFNKSSIAEVKDKIHHLIDVFSTSFLV